MPSERSETARRYVSSRILKRYRLLSLILLVMLAVLVYDLLTGKVQFLLILPAFLFGMVMGWVVRRMYRLEWDAQEDKVVSRLDWLGGIILVLYLVFSLSRDRLLSHWVADASQLAGITLALSVGTLLGRLQGMKHGVLRLAQVWVLKKSD